MARWSNTFMIFYSRLPFSDTTRTSLRAFAEALRKEWIRLRDYINEVYDDRFLTYCSATALDEHGVDMDMPRLPAEADAVYRARLLAEKQSSEDIHTIQAITDAVDALGATYLPLLAVVDIHEYHKLESLDGRRPDSTLAADTWSLGELFGLTPLDYVTFGVLVDRIPTPDEAFAIAEEIRTVMPGGTIGHVITQDPLVVGTSQKYRLRAVAT